MASNKKVLLVEDDFYIRFLYKKVLEKRGIEVLEAENGMQAIDKFTNEKPDLILLDIMLPLASGVQVMQYIRKEAEDKKPVPIIVITNVSVDEANEKTAPYKPDKCLVKADIIPQLLADEVEAMLKD